MIPLLLESCDGARVFHFTCKLAGGIGVGAKGVAFPRDQICCNFVKVCGDVLRASLLLGVCPDKVDKTDFLIITVTMLLHCKDIVA